jgi:hypothetical protein
MFRKKIDFKLHIDHGYAKTKFEKKIYKHFILFIQ